MNRNFNDPLYKQWRQKIRARDLNCCQWPHCVSRKRLHVHHIYKWSDYPGLRYHLNNGITLCKNHHDLIKNNEENYAQFFTKIIQNKQ